MRNVFSVEVVGTIFGHSAHHGLWRWTGWSS